MEENFEEAGHGLQRPHFAGADVGILPDGFIPLRLEMRTLDEIPQVRTVAIAQPIMVLGRHTDADVRLAYADISRRHCRLSFQDRTWNILDLNSLNGVFVNGERVHEAALQEGDYVRLGSVVLIVQSGAKAGSHPWSEVLTSIANNLE
jgi:pSer/pThr/pTyr-binding forkhead associated (FHA) protein